MLNKRDKLYFIFFVSLCYVRLKAWTFIDTLNHYLFYELETDVSFFLVENSFEHIESRVLVWRLIYMVCSTMAFLLKFDRAHACTYIFSSFKVVAKYSCTLVFDLMLAMSSPSSFKRLHKYSSRIYDDLIMKEWMLIGMS